MDLKELVTFQTIVQEGTFSRAAEKLNYAQSTITNQIQRLEKEIGIQLFNRGWDAQLTAAGRLFAAEVDRLIQHWNEVAGLARSLEQEEVGTLRIGTIEAMMEGALPSALRRFNQVKPRIAWQITTGNTDTLAEAMLNEKLDFAICGEPSEASRFYFEPLYEEETVLIADRSHPLCAGSKVPFEALFHYPIVAGGSTCLYALQFNKHLARYKETPTLLHTVSQISSIPHFVKDTLTVGVVLSSTPLIPEVAAINAALELPPIGVGLLQARKHSDPLSSSRQLLLQLIREELEAAQSLKS
ncbi:DNA-binding transcriptional LysR family regulator [Paenibacillus cellulosilyticus]|uniref:DNA-binding transcriptional LysR family regulator n=1 Tax=Paenibacillus cellulosilyticus TaxID=375489 RepID=A0A2V2YT93_9BACL|nr:LysR family transcriptional regulator [Paenibacillus cellulosilyticus]PWW00927.1 DNA-binding transcriptional LysR family regulator [Paenibacillus cellulosilyticus]QKS47580.1 LysR family transcriptional regulator [Paenibacillus cellulosilyticus]